MGNVLADKVIQYSGTLGTGTYDLGAVAGNNRTWRSKFVTGSSVIYHARRTDGTIWEIGRGVLTHGSTDTLSRVEIYDSSDGGTAINWVAGDANYVIFSPQTGMVLDGLLTENLGDTAPTYLPAGGVWTDKSAGIAVRWAKKLRKTFGDATTDVEMGAFEPVANVYVASPRKYWVDNGAANLTMTAAHIGRVIKFDVTAAARTYTLLAGAATGIGHGFTVGIYPYGSEKAVGLVPNGSEVIDGGTAAATMYVPAGRITWLRWDAVSGQWRTDLANSPLMLPSGRITLESGVPVSSTDQTGKATLYYNSIGGHGMFPFRCGAGFALFPLTAELSNDTTASATGAAGPAALGPYQVVDVYGWLNAGVPALTRSAKWLLTATITVTIAAPGVVTHAGHALWDGATVRFTTTGALPTGITASTDYFITKVDANSYKLSTTLANQVAGTYITTSGSQSGVHTVNNYTSVRGTGAGTPELAVVNGIRVNAVAITNGPAIGQGTYLGSVYGNGSSQVDLKFGSSASGGGETVIGIWNAYNAIEVDGTMSDSTDSWNTAVSTPKALNGSSTNRVSMVCGLREKAFKVETQYEYSNPSNLTLSYTGVGFNTNASFSGLFTSSGNPNTVGLGVYTCQGSHRVQPFGFNYFQILQQSDAANTTTFYGDAAGASLGGAKYEGWY